MAKLRKGCAYRRIERAYTRVSKYREKTFIRINPNRKISRYIMGDQRKSFNAEMYLVAGHDVQMRDNSLESARMSSNRHLEKKVGQTGFFMKLRSEERRVGKECRSRWS